MGSTDDKLPLGPDVFKGGKILQFPKKTAEKSPEWTCALDVLKELITDIEQNKIATPDMMFIAMRCSHPTEKDAYAFPRYIWGPPSPGASLLMSGLLHKHLQRL